MQRSGASVPFNNPNKDQTKVFYPFTVPPQAFIHEQPTGASVGSMLREGAPCAEVKEESLKDVGVEGGDEKGDSQYLVKGRTQGLRLAECEIIPSGGEAQSGNEKPGVASFETQIEIGKLAKVDNHVSGNSTRKDLALERALSHSMTVALHHKSTDSPATKHHQSAFTHVHATDVTLDGIAFSFQEFAPTIFFSIRGHFGVDHDAYVHSMSELRTGHTGEGKSGMLFFSSADGRLIVKTVTGDETKLLDRDLKSYYDYMVVNGATSLLPRFMGLYLLKLPDKPLVRMLVMNNVLKLPRATKLTSSIELSEIYDLKGSLHMRLVGAEEQALGEVTVLKDLNFCSRHAGTDHHGHSFPGIEGPCRRVYLGPIRKIELLANLQSDVEWLKQHNIMDYSLLLAVGFEVSPDGGLIAPPVKPADPVGTLAVVEDPCVGAGHPQMAASQEVPGGQQGERRSRGTDGGRWESAWSTDMGGVRGMNGDFTPRAEIYYMGLIDVLQEYNAKKRAEHALKSITADSSKISSVDPSFYAERFLDWLQTHVG